MASVVFTEELVSTMLVWLDCKSIDAVDSKSVDAMESKSLDAVDKWLDTVDMFMLTAKLIEKF